MSWDGDLGCIYTYQTNYKVYFSWSHFWAGIQMLLRQDRWRDVYFTSKISWVRSEAHERVQEKNIPGIIVVVTYGNSMEGEISKFCIKISLLQFKTHFLMVAFDCFMWTYTYNWLGYKPSFFIKSLCQRWIHLFFKATDVSHKCTGSATVTKKSTFPSVMN